VTVQLLQKRRYKITVIREDQQSVLQTGTRGEVLGTNQRGSGFTLRLPAGENDVLHALNASGPQVRVLMSGMVGSAHGWVQAPYLGPEVRLRELGHHLLRVPGTARRVDIVPGIALKTATAVDVMRGEETQLLGAALLGHEDGWFLLPGTHSKWVRMAEGRVADFATFMTGELFDLLGRHGTLAAAAGAEHAGADAHQPEAFGQGLQAGADVALSHALFGCRARVVTGALPPEQARAYLSGLLIGAEWHELRRRGAGHLPTTVTVIGAPHLAARLHPPLMFGHCPRRVLFRRV
jgi:2-dehydro-3-deoxygalactonokinase